MLLLPTTGMILVLRVHVRPSLPGLDITILIQTRFVGELTIVLCERIRMRKCKRANGRAARAKAELEGACGGNAGGIGVDGVDGVDEVDGVDAGEWANAVRQQRAATRDNALPAASVIATKCISDRCQNFLQQRFMRSSQICGPASIGSCQSATLMPPAARCC
jgi:hypothetical protein